MHTPRKSKPLSAPRGLASTQATVVRFRTLPPFSFDEDIVTPDGCAICGVVKTECMNQAEHFGTRGESPPDAKCPWCKMGFWNRYDSEHQLQLHVAQRHAGK